MPNEILDFFEALRNRFLAIEEIGGLLGDEVIHLLLVGVGRPAVTVIELFLQVGNVRRRRRGEGWVGRLEDRTAQCWLPSKVWPSELKYLISLKASSDTLLVAFIDQPMPSAITPRALGPLGGTVTSTGKS